jgi:hypothetical protein
MRLRHDRFIFWQAPARLQSTMQKSSVSTTCIASQSSVPLDKFNAREQQELPNRNEFPTENRLPIGKV